MLQKISTDLGKSLMFRLKEEEHVNFCTNVRAFMLYLGAKKFS